MAQYIDVANVSDSEPVVSLSIISETNCANSKGKEKIGSEASICLDEEEVRLKKSNSLGNGETTSQDVVISVDEKPKTISVRKKEIEPNDDNIRNAETQTRIRASPRRRKSPAKERFSSPSRRRIDRHSARRSPARRISERTMEEYNSGKRNNASPSRTQSEASASKFQPKENCCESERSMNRHHFGARSPLQPLETVRRIPSDTFAACHAAFLHSAPDVMEVDESILLPLQSAASFDDDWLINSVSSLVKSGPAACCLAETIEDRVASTSVLSLGEGSLCRLLPLGNTSPRLKKNDSSSSSSTEVESVASDSSVCRRNTQITALGATHLRRK